MNEVVMALLSGWIIFYFAVFLPGPNTFFVASVGISGQKKQIWVLQLVLLLVLLLGACLLQQVFLF